VQPRTATCQSYFLSAETTDGRNFVDFNALVLLDVPKDASKGTVVASPLYDQRRKRLCAN
jgi:hypothetical protein